MSPRPSGPHRRAVIAGVELDCVAHDVGDRFDLDLGNLTARDTTLGVKQGVAKLVDQGLDRLSRGDVRTNGDLFVEEVAISVLTTALLADHIKPRLTRLRHKPVPDAFRSFSVQQLGPNSIQIREVIAFGLRDVLSRDFSRVLVTLISVNREE